MRRPWFNSKRVLLFTVGALGVAAFMPSRTARPLADVGRDLVMLVLTPVSDPLKSVSDTLRGVEDAPVDLGNAADYEHAKQMIAQLQTQLREAREQVAQLTQVREHLSMGGVQLKQARVTSWSGNRLAPVLTLNRGSAHGVRRGQIVAAGFNLVGRVVDTASVTATVQLVTAPGPPVAVRFVPAKVDAAPSGDPRLAAQLEPITSGGKIIFQAVIDASAPVAVGDLAILEDKSWPRDAIGFVVGAVTDIKPQPDDPTLRNQVTITPNRSLANLSEVVVVIPVGDGS